MHREYHQIYKLSKYFSAHNICIVKEVKDSEIANLQKNYLYFCELLSIFAVTHFNFNYNDEYLINFARLNMSFNYKGWKLTLKASKCGIYDILTLCIEKENKYSIVIIPSVSKDNDELLAFVKQNMQADEFTVFTPFEKHGENSMLISITSIESFRRIQQIVLRGMVYADTAREDCPFCNNKLSNNGESGSAGYPVYKCFSCRTEIYTGHCTASGKSFQFTKIAGLTNQLSESDDWLLERKKEAQMYFRNITKINGEMEIVCPHCNKVHQ